MTSLDERHAHMIAEAAALLVTVADDSGASLVDVIAELERHVVEETKVGDGARMPVQTGRRGYTLVDGRLVEVGRSA